MVLAFFTKNLVNVAMRMEEPFYNISMYLYNKNVLEYAQIARSGPKSMIRDIEGLSNVYTLFLKIQLHNFCRSILSFSSKSI